MHELIVTLALGALICFFGVRNMIGDISSLHSYHRNRVSPDDVKPFGKLVGIGTLIVGISVLIYSLFILAFEMTKLEIFHLVGAAVMILGIIVGLAVSFYAMKKYNGGIF